jgi:hypothetical protein
VVTLFLPYAFVYLPYSFLSVFLQFNLFYIFQFFNNCNNIMEGKQPEDYVTWRLNLFKEDLNKMDDPSLKLYPIPPNNPWGIDPGLFPNGVTKDKYKKLIDRVVERDMKKIREEEEVDKFINQMQGPSAQTRQTNKLMGNLDKISENYNREAIEDKQLFSDLDKIYIEYKGSYMKSMIQYIKYDKFLQCHKGDMAKAEACLYELKDYIQKLDNPTDNENIVLFTINSIIMLYQTEDIDDINTIYTNWYNTIMGSNQQGATVSVGGKKKKKSKKKKRSKKKKSKKKKRSKKKTYKK